MNSEQKLSAIMEFAKQHYQARMSVHKLTLLQHAVSVAKLAEQIGERLYKDVRQDCLSEETKESLAIIVHGALLHDVINVSRCAFEHIAEQTTVQVAAMVADLSRDFRLVETKRDMEFRGRLAASTVGTQIVAVADIICTAKEVVDMLNSVGYASVSRAKKAIIQLDGDLLSIHAASRFHALRLYSHAARNLLQDASKLIKECRQKTRAARAAAVAENNIRAKIAARKAAAPPEASSSKEKRRGKKRAD